MEHGITIKWDQRNEFLFALVFLSLLYRFDLIAQVEKFVDYKKTSLKIADYEGLMTIFAFGISIATLAVICEILLKICKKQRVVN